MNNYENEKEMARLKRYEALVKFIANDYIELSHDKVQNEYLHIIKRCRKLVEEDAENLILKLANPVYYDPKDDF